MITSYKGFDKDLKYRGFAFEIGASYEHTGAVKQCRSGFHACPRPLDTFSYYPPASSRYAVVKQHGALDWGDDKVASSIIEPTAEITLHALAQAHVASVLMDISPSDAATNTGGQSAATNTGGQSAATNTGYRSAATNTGYRSAATNTGDQSAATNTGGQSAATNTGGQSAATNTGYRSAATNTGYRSAATNTGDQSAATNTGDRSAATNTGYRSAATNTGYRSAATNTGQESVAVATGYQSKARAASGSWIVVVERDEEGHILTILTGQAGRDVAPDTFYRVVGGVFVEAED